MVFPDKLEKQIFIYKQLQQAKINFHIYKVVFLEKKKRKTPGDIIILPLSTKNLGHYGTPFTENQKNQNFENMKNNCWKYLDFALVY